MLQDVTNDPASRPRTELKPFTTNDLLKEASKAGMAVMKKQRRQSIMMHQSPQNPEAASESDEMKQALIEIEELKSKNIRLQYQCDAANSAKNASFDREDEQRMKVAEQKELVEAKRKELKSVKQSNESLVNRVLKLEEQLAESEAQLSSTKEELASLQSSFSEIIEERERDEMEQNQAMRAMTDDMDAKETESTKRLIETEQNNIKLKQRIEALEREVDQFQHASFSKRLPQTTNLLTSPSAESTTMAPPLKLPLKQNQAALSRAAVLLKAVGRRSPSSPQESVISASSNHHDTDEVTGQEQATPDSIAENTTLLFESSNVSKVEPEDTADEFVCTDAKAFGAGGGNRRRSVRILQQQNESVVEPENDEVEPVIYKNEPKKRKTKKKPMLSMQEVLELTSTQRTDPEPTASNEVGILKEIEDIMTQVEVEPSVPAKDEDGSKPEVGTRKSRRRRSGVHGKTPSVAREEEEEAGIDAEWGECGGLLHWSAPATDDSLYPEDVFQTSLDEDRDQAGEESQDLVLAAYAPSSVAHNSGVDEVHDHITKLAIEPNGDVVTTQAVLALALGLCSDDQATRPLMKLFKAAVNVELKVLKMDQYDASYRHQKKGGASSNQVTFSVHDLSSISPPIDSHKNSERPTETVVSALLGFFEARDEVVREKGDSGVMETFATLLIDIANELEAKSSKECSLLQLIEPSCGSLSPFHLAHTARILASEFSLESNVRMLKLKITNLASSALRFHLRRNLNAPPPPATTPTSFQQNLESYATEGCRSKAYLLFRLEASPGAPNSESPFDGAVASLIGTAVAAVYTVLDSNYASNLAATLIPKVNAGCEEALKQGIVMIEGVKARRFLADLLECPGLDKAVELNGGWGQIEHFANVLARFDEENSNHFSLLGNIADLREIVANPLPGEITSAQEKKLNTAISSLKKKYTVDPSAKKRGGRKPPKRSPEFLDVLLEEDLFEFPEVITNEEI